MAMLHEILLSLSGIPSPIFEDINLNDKQVDSRNGSFTPYISEPEREMLKILASIADLQSKVKEKSISLSTSQYSPICRAISTSIRTTHLQAFTNKVLEVESAILRNDAAYVGAYRSVPLSTLLTEFQPWSRPLRWLSKTLEFLLTGCSTGKVFSYLDRECQTGYSDLKDIATALLVIAEQAWINCMMPWLLFGELPRTGNNSFMVQISGSDGDGEYEVDRDHTPYFVSDDAADSILAVGKAISQIRSRKWQQAGTGSLTDSLSQLQPFVLQKVESLSYPITINDLDQVVESVNNRLSETTLAQFLPADMIIDLLHIAKQFLLLQDNDFTATLIKQTSQHLQLQTATSVPRPVRKLGRLEDFKVSETELSTMLSNTWSELLVNVPDDRVWRDAMAWIRLTSEIPSAPINILLPTPAGLRLYLPPESPLQMFMSVTDIKKYAEISAYLASLQCAKMRIVDLWSKPDLRRRTRTTKSKQRSSKAIRETEDQRLRLVRPHWVCASQIILLLSELIAYLHGEVIESSWSEFQSWLGEQRDSRPSSSRYSSRPATASSKAYTTSIADREPASLRASTKSTSRRNDPRVLARAHRAFLDTLYQMLLISNKAYISILRDLLNSVTHLTALFHRVQVIWEGLDHQQDRQMGSVFSDFSKEERELLGEMDRSRTNITDIIHDLISSIREAEKKRDITDLGSGLSEVSLQDRGEFKPWTARSLDRLLMKLDSMAGDEKEELYEDAIVGDET